LKREIPREQMIKLLQTGKTDLIDKFISKKGRPFNAYLKFGEGKVSFEFEPRKPRAPKPGAKKKSAKAEEKPEQAAEQAEEKE
jgi:DNA topoisomerase-3